MVVGPPKPDYHTFVFSNVCHFTCIWSRALKLGCITNVNMLFLTNGFIGLFYENKFMLVSAIFRIGLLDSSKRITTCTTISILSLNFSIFSSVN